MFRGSSSEAIIVWHKTLVYCYYVYFSDCRSL